MSGKTNNTSSQAPQKRTRFFSGVVLGGMFGAVLTIAVGATASFDRGAMFGMGGFDGEFSKAKREMVVEFVLTRIGADDAQTAEIQTILDNAMSEMKPIFSDKEQAKNAFLELVQAPQVDRAALEELRVQAMQKADRSSQRMAQTLADISDVLTPEQRTKLIEMRKQMRPH